MTVYPVTDPLYSHPQQPNAQTWALDHAAKLERRLELGHHLDPAAHRWLHKPSQLPRLALWHELLTFADVDGVCDVATLATWHCFDTQRKRDYVLTMLEQYNLVTRLEQTRVQVVS